MSLCAEDSQQAFCQEDVYVSTAWNVFSGYFCQPNHGNFFQFLLLFAHFYSNWGVFSTLLWGHFQTSSHNVCKDSFSVQWQLSGVTRRAVGLLQVRVEIDLVKKRLEMSGQNWPPEDNEEDWEEGEEEECDANSDKQNYEWCQRSAKVLPKKCQRSAKEVKAT